MTTPIVLDCDTGIDDTLALLYLLAHPDADLRAVLSTAGNVPVDQVVANNQALLQLCGRGDIEVCRGADAPLATELRTCEETHGPQGIGHAERPPYQDRLSQRDAATAWIELTRDHPGELVGLVIGPCTNLALAIRQDPELPSRLRGLVIMGGSFVHPGNTTPVAEWNVLVDPESAHEVFTAFGTGGAPKPIICALQLTEQVAFQPSQLDALAELVGCPPAERPGADDDHGRRPTGSPATDAAPAAPAAGAADHPGDNRIVRLLSDALRFYFEFHDSVGEGYLAHVHDPFAAAVALHPAIVQTREAVVDVELVGTLTRGMTVADERGFWQRPANALIAERTDVAAFFDDLLARLAALARRVG